MGLFAPPATRVLVWLGSRRAIAGCLLIIGVFGVARAVVPDAGLVILLTFGVGVGMGLLGAMMPIAVKERFLDRPAFATGVYALGINIGAGASAATAVPIADATYGWRGSFVVFSAITVGLALVWLTLSRGTGSVSRAPIRPAPLPWRNGFVWLLIAIFVLLAVLYYGLNAWLAATYVERGWSEARAAWLVATLNLTALPCTIIVAWMADKIGSRRLYLAGGSAIASGAMLGIVFWPEGGFLWAVVLGIAAGPLFTVLMTLPLDIADEPAQVGAVAGLMLGFGYGLGAFAPLLLGAVRDWTGSVTAVMWAIAATIAVTFLCLGLTRHRLRTGLRGPLAAQG